MPETIWPVPFPQHAHAYANYSNNAYSYTVKRYTTKIIILLLLPQNKILSIFSTFTELK